MIVTPAKFVKEVSFIPTFLIQVSVPEKVEIIMRCQPKRRCTGHV